MNSVLIGLPSSGKSSIINSLVGKRVAQSGISRTTTDVKLYDDLISDDNINFKIYDVPGIADIEDNQNNFDTLIFDTIKKCNLVIWVSDIIKSFITNHEMNEFNKIKKHIKNLELNEGLPIQLIILLSKVDKELKSCASNCDNSIKQLNDEIIDEITGNEETMIEDIYKNVKDKFNDIDIILFNAHGRSYHHAKSSSNLKKFVKQYNPTDSNIQFNLKKYYDNIPLINNRIKLHYIFETWSKSFHELTKSSKCCDTNNINMPDNLKLWCVNSNCLAIECVNKDCINCNNKNYSIRCKVHNYPIDYMNSMSTSNHAVCYHRYRFLFEKQKNISCVHGYNIKNCCNHIDYKFYADKFMEIYNSLLFDENKTKLLRLILSCSKHCHKMNIIKIDNDHINMLCRFMKIDIKNYHNQQLDCDNACKNQIYRLIQIGNDFNNYDKLYLYVSVNHGNYIDLLDNRKFYFENIYNIESFLSGDMFKLDNYDSIRKEYTTEIYKTSILKQVKEIRKKIFGDIDDDIDISMIPIAYDKYGLFWKP